MSKGPHLAWWRLTNEGIERDWARAGFFGPPPPAVLFRPIVWQIAAIFVAFCALASIVGPLIAWGLSS